MSRHEITWTRDLLPSLVHRMLDDDFTATDVDFCEYCANCREPLALLEFAAGVDRWKPMTVTGKLATRAQIPAFAVAYEPDGQGSIAQFRVRRWPGTAAVDLDLQGFRELLRGLREAHRPSCPARKREDSVA